MNNAGGRFDVQGGKIVVANGALLDFEGQKSHVIVVEVTDKGGTGLTFQKQFTITLTNENEAPTSVTLNGAGTVVENAPDNLVVGTLTGADPDGNNTLTLSLADDAGGRFKIVGNQLQVADGSSSTSRAAARATPSRCARPTPEASSSRRSSPSR